MKLLGLALILLAGCATSRPPMPPIIQRQALISATSADQPQVITPPSFHRGVTWDYIGPMPYFNVGFDIESSTNLTDWTLIITTNQPPVHWDSPNPTEFIRAGAHWIDPSIE